MKFSHFLRLAFAVMFFSFNKPSDKNRCAYAGDYVGMSIKKTGRYEVENIIDKPISPALFFPKIANYNGGFIVSRKAIQAMGYEAFKKHPVGTGPFKFDSYEKDKPLDNPNIPVIEMTTHKGIQHPADNKDAFAGHICMPKLYQLLEKTLPRRLKSQDAYGNRF